MSKVEATLNTTHSPELFAFTAGIDMDCFLYQAEIRVQKAWAHALARARVFTEQEAEMLTQALDEAQGLIGSGQFSWAIEDEDIHMNLERFLTERLGDLGKRLHLGRSRNDLIATTLRLYVAEELGRLVELINDLATVIAHKSLDWIEIITPGMTHLQSGQPIRFGHAFVSYAQGLSRDVDRFLNAQKNALMQLPLGAAAFAGTHLSLDLLMIAQELGFAGVTENSYDAVGDRDFILEALNAFSILGVRLSRFCEEMMFYTATPVALLKLSPQWSTGSSIMPNKRNPDVCELARAKMARVISAANEGAMLVRAVIPSYGSDLHELKRTFLSAKKELAACLSTLQPFTEGLSIDTERASAMLKSGHLLATDIATALVTTGMPFRDAYREVASLIKEADALGLQIEDLPCLKNVLPDACFTMEGALESRNSPGGTSLASAKASITQLLLKLNSKCKKG